MKRRPLINAFGALCLAGGRSLAQQPYPNKPVRVFVPFAPGGLTDTSARMVLAEVSKILGEIFVIENRAGGGGAVGLYEVGRAAPDGYTLLWAGPEVASVWRPKGEEPLVPVALAATAPVVAVVPTQSTFRDFRQLLDSRQSVVGGSGGGYVERALISRLKADKSLRIAWEPYSSSGVAIASLTGGKIQVAIASYPNVKQQIDEKRVKIIASSTRLPDGTTAPPLTIAGLPGVSLEAFVGLFAPRGTPQSVVKTLNGAVNKALGGGLSERLASLGMQVRRGDPKALSDVVLSTISYVADVCKVRSECEKDAECPKPCPT